MGKDPLAATENREVIACLDAAYGAHVSAAGCAAFEAWTSSVCIQETCLRLGPAEAYQPGAFFRRELPLLLGVLAASPHRPTILVIDGYVHLGADKRPGLGAHLHEALGGEIGIVGVAKTSFRTAGDWSAPVLRGASGRPLYVTAIGVALEDAVSGVRSMSGRFRIPDMIRRADHLARQSLADPPDAARVQTGKTHPD